MNELVDSTVRHSSNKELTLEVQSSIPFVLHQIDNSSLFLDPPYTPTFEGHTAPFMFSDSLFDFLNDAKREHVAYQSDVALGSIASPIGQHLVTFAFDWDGEHAFLDDRLNSPMLPTRAERNNFGLNQCFALTSQWEFGIGSGY